MLINTKQLIANNNSISHSTLPFICQLHISEHSHIDIQADSILRELTNKRIVYAGSANNIPAAVIKLFLPRMRARVYMKGEPVGHRALQITAHLNFFIKFVSFLSYIREEAD